MSHWLTEGTAHRSPVKMFPVRHLLVADTMQMWCSGGKGREDYALGDRMCRACRRLAEEAVADETLDPAELRGRGWVE